MTIRVLHVINSGEVGGGGTHLLHLIPGLTRRGFSSEVAVGRAGFASDELHAAGTPIHVLGPMGITAPFPISALCRSVRPDLLHLHGSRAGFLGTLAVRLVGAQPVVYTAHAFAFKRRLSRPLRWLAARADGVTCARADRVICLTTADVRAAAAHGITVTHATVIANGIDLNRYREGRSIRHALGFDPAAPVVGMVARLVPDKDPLTFVRAAAQVWAEIPEARFLLVGDGPLRKDIEDGARALGVTDRLTVTGFRHDVPDLLASMDVVVLTSRWEGMPVSALEAMAAGKPLVASALPGLEAVIEDGTTGFLVPPGVEAHFARKVIDLLRHAGRRAALGARARRKAAEEFGFERMVSATADLYRSTLASRGLVAEVRTT
jgi:glycosyltransferase involved in cell wall biosynthesis